MTKNNKITDELLSDIEKEAKCAIRLFEEKYIDNCGNAKDIIILVEYIRELEQKLNIKRN